MKNFDEFEIVNHGYHYPDYFQGCGTAYTMFNQCVTGFGMNEIEAYEDALESMAQMDYNVESMPEGKEIGLNSKIDENYINNGANYYLSIRFKE